MSCFSLHFAHDSLVACLLRPNTRCMWANIMQFQLNTFQFIFIETLTKWSKTMSCNYIYVHNIIYTLYIYRGCLVMKMAPIE